MMMLRFVRYLLHVFAISVTTVGTYFNAVRANSIYLTRLNVEVLSTDYNW